MSLVQVSRRKYMQ